MHLLLCSLSCSISLFLSVFPKPIGALFLIQKPASEERLASAELTSLSVHTSLKAKRQVPSV